MVFRGRICTVDKGLETEHTALNDSEGMGGDI